MSEHPEHRIKRLIMRSMRRGIKEMDIILERFARQNLAQMDDAGLMAYDEMLSENDHDLYQWVTGQAPAPAPYAALVETIISQLPQR
jgi:antitoxin CptB